MNPLDGNVPVDNGSKVPFDRLARLWLLIGFLLLPFSSWQRVIPLAAWLAPVFLLRFVRTTDRRLALPLIFVAYAASIVPIRTAYGGCARPAVMKEV